MRCVSTDFDLPKVRLEADKKGFFYYQGAHLYNSQNTTSLYVITLSPFSSYIVDMIH